ncbi:Protein CBG04855 [Caenorhabditis briggsae]|uniref:Protein CBG04855 n=2 Tax=Caenorhabditis briggsae TaxID=6238 RepID=A8WYM7_CAEBR|nr:Protein CBG04855 [Caenorhabditis briggsae]CAP25485.2 Protein CBG04855 [Caenorhabditis briggsae]
MFFMMDSQPEFTQPIRTRAICFLLISSLIYIAPIVCLILAGIHSYDDYISDWKFWNFATISCFIIYFLAHCIQIFGQAKHDKNLEEKSEFPDEERFQKNQKRLNNVKLILKTVYFILSLYGFYISYNVLDVLETGDYRYEFYWAFFLYCTFSLLIFILPVVVFLFGRILDLKRSLHEKTVENLKCLI